MTNATAIKIGNEISSNSLSLSDRMNSLSSGKRIQSASDDSANLQVSNRLNKIGSGLQVAIRNANDGLSVLQTAEGALQESTNILQRMRELSIQAANATNNTSDLQALNGEFSNLKSELDRIAETTTFGGQNLLNGSYGMQAFQVGSDANEIINGTIPSVLPKDLQLNKVEAKGAALGGIYTGNSLLAAQSRLSLEGFGNGAAGPGSESLEISGIRTASIQLNASDSAENMASDFNSVSSVTGVKSNAMTHISLHIHDGTSSNRTPFEKGENISFDIGNGQNIATISFTASGDYKNDLETLANRINEQAALTSIGAKTNPSDGKLELKSYNGSNISISNYQESSEATNNILELGNIDPTGTTTNFTTVENNGTAAILRGFVSLNMPSGESFSLSSNIDFGMLNDGLGSNSSERFSESVSLLTTDILSQDKAQEAIDIIDSSLANIDRARSSIGAVSNRLVSTVSNLANVFENTENARGRLVDADYSKEAAELAKLQVTQQASTALLGQANSLPEQAITLLG